MHFLKARLILTTVILLLTQGLRGQPAPEILVSPNSRSTNAGGTTTFTVAATGGTPLSYQWRKDGTPIPGATRSSHAVGGIQAAAAGGYDVVVSNSAGSSTSGVAVLTVVTTLPTGQTVTPGTSATLYVAASSGRAPLGYQWTRNGIPLPGATAAVLSLPAFTAGDVGAYECNLTPAGGMPFSTGPVNLLLGPDTPPNFALFSNPNNYARLRQRVLLLAGRTYSFQARVLSPQGFSLSGSAFPEFASAAGNYEDMTGKIEVTEEPRMVTASGKTHVRAAFRALRDIECTLQLALWRQAECRITEIGLVDTATNRDLLNNGRFDRGKEFWSFGPEDPFATLGSLFVAGSPAAALVIEQARHLLNPPEIFGAGPFSYQWLRDGAVIPGATRATHAIASARSGDTGNYSLIVENSQGSRISAAARITVAPSCTLSNLSVRTTLAAGQTLIVGAVISGGPRSILLRAAGPALNKFGLVGMDDPRLELYTGTTMVGSNDTWSTGLAATFSRVGAFAFDPGSLDAALNQSISGAFTVQTRGTGPGTVLVEAYDAAGGVTPRLVNLSARNQVGSGADILIAGFALSGSGTKQVLIRAIGPTLAAFGVGGALADPRLTLLSGAGAILAENDNWGTPVGSAAAATTATFAQVGAFPLAAGSRDAALLITLNAGASYTVQVAGVNNTTGEALIEVYEVF